LPYVPTRRREASKRTSPNERILKTDIERRVRKTGERKPALPNNILGPAVIIPHRILDVHVDHHAVALVAADGRRDDDQRVPVDKIADTSLVFRRMPCLCLEIELQRERALQHGQQCEEETEGCSGHG
jgi:hypothetical protein